MWVVPNKLGSKPSAIPVARALNIWELPSAEGEPAAQNPFDKLIDLSNNSESGKRLDVLLQGVQKADIANLNLKEIYDVKQGSLNSVWVTLDIRSDEFKEINLLLTRFNGSSEIPYLPESFWDKLLFQMTYDVLRYERQSRIAYYLKIKSSAVANNELMSQLTALIVDLKQKSTQLKLVFDSTVSLETMPKVVEIAKSLRALGCGIVLEKFSVDSMPLYLYRELKPDCVFFDKHWLESLKEKKDGCLFLSRFVQQLENNHVSVMLPKVLQSRQDRLLVLSGISFSQENAVKNCA